MVSFLKKMSNNLAPVGQELNSTKRNQLKNFGTPIKPHSTPVSVADYRIQNFSSVIYPRQFSLEKI